MTYPVKFVNIHRDSHGMISHKDGTIRSVLEKSKEQPKDIPHWIYHRIIVSGDETVEYEEYWYIKPEHHKVFQCPYTIEFGNNTWTLIFEKASDATLAKLTWG
jgi:hypothetical protein